MKVLLLWQLDMAYFCAINEVFCVWSWLDTNLRSNGKGWSLWVLDALRQKAVPLKHPWMREREKQHRNNIAIIWNTWGVQKFLRGQISQELTGSYFTTKLNLIYNVCMHILIWVSKFFFFFLKEINYFIQQGCIKLIKSDSKDNYVTKYFYFKWMLFKNHEKTY